MRRLCGLYAGGMRALCGWYAGGMRVVCACYAVAMPVYAGAGVCLVVGPLWGVGDHIFARMASTQTTKPVYSTDAMQPRLAVRKSPRYTPNYDHIALQPDSPCTATCMLHHRLHVSPKVF